jgi:hypothetical protein
MTTIKFTKKRQRTYLVAGLLWIVLGIISLLTVSQSTLGYGALVLGILYLGTYLFEAKNQYLTIENGVITKNHFIPKKVAINEIVKIKRFIGTYVLETNAIELIINTEIIDKSSLNELNDVLNRVSLKKV